MRVSLPETKVGRGDIGAELLDFLGRSGYGRVRIVADANTWGALGRSVEAGLGKAGIVVVTLVFEGELQADEAALGLLVAEEAAEPAPLIAVGSGTVTDIVRLYAARMRLPFVSLPTAASVDAYASSVSAMTIRGAKRTIAAAAPRAIFADIETLRAAPAPMTAAGFGDMLCKFSALADWRLGALVWGEAWDEGIAARTRAATERCLGAASLVGAREAEGLETLIGALIESGMAMSLAGHSRPASGAEHHLSHYWEMRLAREGRQPILHGLKVGVATALVAGLWERIRDMDQEEAEARLSDAVLPRAREEEERIEGEFGAAANSIKASQRRFLALDAGAFGELKRTIINNWTEIRGLAASVPGAAETRALLSVAGCPTRPSELGLEPKLVESAWAFGHLLRDRFTVRRLAALLGLECPGA
ncbi:MAG TPA: sn-glycerol-1-phosphate dehydrogenase [Rectinemataceae bacterium]|nr:sn-glycerol-1-phosphate dehydrogenase [Rectinemataceae bacterium]